MSEGILGLMDSKSRRSKVHHTHPSSFVTNVAAIHYAFPLVLCLPATSPPFFANITVSYYLIQDREIGFSMRLKKFPVSTSPVRRSKNAISLHLEKIVEGLNSFDR